MSCSHVISGAPIDASRAAQKTTRYLRINMIDVIIGSMAESYGRR